MCGYWIQAGGVENTDICVCEYICAECIGNVELCVCLHSELIGFSWFCAVGSGMELDF